MLAKVAVWSQQCHYICVVSMKEHGSGYLESEKAARNFQLLENPTVLGVPFVCVAPTSMLLREPYGNSARMDRETLNFWRNSIVAGLADVGYTAKMAPCTSFPDCAHCMSPDCCGRLRFKAGNKQCKLMIFINTDKYVRIHSWIPHTRVKKYMSWIHIDDLPDPNKFGEETIKEAIQELLCKLEIIK